MIISDVGAALTQVHPAVLESLDSYVVSRSTLERLVGCSTTELPDTSEANWVESVVDDLFDDVRETSRGAWEVFLAPFKYLAPVERYASRISRSRAFWTPIIARAT